MLEGIGRRFEAFARRYMPDPFVLALALTALVVGVLAVRGQYSVAKVVQFWFIGNEKAPGTTGFWALLLFAMQMVLIVVTGEAVAAAPLVRRALQWLARVPKTAFAAAAFVSFVAMGLSLIHWGFGLVSASLLARETAAQAKARGLLLHYPLLGAAAYTAQLIWHGGLSGSAPLFANSSDPKTNILFGLIGKVPYEQTVFTPMNFIACGLLLLSVPFIVAAMTPAPERREEAADGVLKPRGETAAPASAGMSFAERIDRSPILPWLIVLLLGTALVMHFRAKGFDLNPNIINAFFLMLGLALHGSPVAYMKAVAQSMRGTAGIVIQFPFYGGIMGLVQESGLGHEIAGVFTNFANAHTLPFFTYVSSVVAKLFIPSGAGEWAVEGPVMLTAAKNLGANTGCTIMAIAYGNMVGNMFQPFWSLPLLGIMGLKAREIMGYCLVLFCFAFPLLGVMLWVAG